MGYAEVYRKRRNIWRRMARWATYVMVFGVLSYFSIALLSDNSGMMMGGTIGGGSGPTPVAVSE